MKKSITNVTNGEKVKCSKGIRAKEKHHKTSQIVTKTSQKIYKPPKKFNIFLGDFYLGVN